MRFVVKVIVALTALVGSTFAASAQKQLDVVCSHAFLSAMEDIAPAFERETGYRLTISFGTSGDIVRRLGGDTAPDLVIVTRSALQGLISQGRVRAEGAQDLAATGIGLAVRAGAAAPDLSSPEALKQALLSARSLAYSDPASGGASGIHFAKVVKELKLEEALKAKTILVPNGGNVGEVVASGGAEFGVQMNSELIPVKGVQFVGGLPAALNDMTMFSAGIPAKAQRADGAATLIAYLASPAVRTPLTANGLTPAKN